MTLVDLQYPVQNYEDDVLDSEYNVEHWENDKNTTRMKERIHPTYTSRVCYFSHWSNVGTYIDFPGHVIETDDGYHAENYPLEKLYRLESPVIHLNRESGSGRIELEELKSHCPKDDDGAAIVINGLGRKQFYQVSRRGVHLSIECVRWIIDKGFHLVVSDVYDNVDYSEGVLMELFKHGVTIIGRPINLDKITEPKAKITALPVRFPGVTQLPCRVMAEF